MKKILLLIIILLVGCSNEYKTASVEEMYLNQNEFIILDVRTITEYNEGHIENSINVPVDDISNFEQNKDTEIYVYCRSGARSKDASYKLIEMGYKNVYDLGGIATMNISLVK